jgi:glycosyltransferase involved in cell wall biosynthesis
METQQKSRNRICFGMTLYNNAGYLPEAIESLLGQSYGDFHLVTVDDCSNDETEELMRQYEARDKRISYFRNETWSGMIATWRTAFQKAYQLCQPNYFAWASDHDRWHPEWLKHHVDALNEHPEVVLVYPQTVPISTEGETLSHEQPEPFDTQGMRPVDRMYHACTKQSGAGHAIYGLFRVKPLVTAGIFRRVILPDRLLITEISAYGSVKQIPVPLWFRRYFGPFKTHEETVAAQIKTLFGPSQVPIHAYCPFLSHVISLILSLSIFPADKDYSTFWKGLLMSGLLWETYRKKFIETEFETLRRFLAATESALEPKRQQIQPDFQGKPLESGTIIEEIGLLGESLLDHSINGFNRPSNILNVLIVGLMINRDKQLTNLQQEIKQARAETEQARAELEQVRVKLERASAETERAKTELGQVKVEIKHARQEVERWKAEAHLSFLSRIKRKIKQVSL